MNNTYTRIIYDVRHYVSRQWEEMPWSKTTYIDDAQSSLRLYRQREPFEIFAIFKTTITYQEISRNEEELA